MKIKSLLVLILVIFVKTGNVLSDQNLFNVNNIELTKKKDITNEELANQALKKGFYTLIEKILLEEDINELSNLTFKNIKELVAYYQVDTDSDNIDQIDKVKFNIFFDKDKLHSLFFKKNISYSEVNDKELYLLPVLSKNNKIYIFNQNFFYENWNILSESDLIEFILPIENIEIIQNINLNQDNILDVELKNIFKEYSNKNLSLIFIQDTNSVEEKIFLKMLILGKSINKNIKIKRNQLDNESFYKEIINKINKEIINTIKSQNLIDVKVPSFLNTRLSLGKNNSLVELNNRLKKIDLIDNIYVMEFNKDYVVLKIKYLGKLNKIIKQLEKERIILRRIDEQWELKII